MPLNALRHFCNELFEEQLSNTVLRCKPQDARIRVECTLICCLCFVTATNWLFSWCRDLLHVKGFAEHSSSAYSCRWLSERRYMPQVAQCSDQQPSTGPFGGKGNSMLDGPLFAPAASLCQHAQVRQLFLELNSTHFHQPARQCESSWICLSKLNDVLLVINCSAALFMSARLVLFAR